MNLDVKGRELIKFNPNLIIPWFLMVSYLYYHKNQSLFSDEYYDELSKELASRWDQVEHRYKHLIIREHLIAGSLYTLKEEDYPEMCKAGALLIAKELGE